MASYQIPQFLDSGDKILGPLNLRQFGYALGGGFLGFIIYTIVQNIVPQAGFFALLPAAPIFGLAAYLALGKYNGRDSEIYVLQMVIYNLQPRLMKYRRLADVTDLNSKLAKLTVVNLEKEWQKRIQEQSNARNNKIKQFRDRNSEQKAEQIRDISFSVDTSLRNTLANVKRKEIQIEQHQHAMNVMQNIKQKNREYTQSPLLQQAPAPYRPTDSSADEVNFFNDSK